MSIENIIDAYFLARKNSRKSPDLVEFELHWERNCVRLCDTINNRSYQPTAYTFVVLDPKPREIFASDMSTCILHHYLHARLLPLLEKRLSKHTFNNRKGMGTSACLKAVMSDIYEVSKEFTQDAWIIKLDISGCFPNIVQDIAYKLLEEVILQDYKEDDKDDLLYILKVCIFSNPTLHCELRGDPKRREYINPEKSLFSKPIGIGAAIGHLVWQMAVTYYFNDILLWLESIGIKVNMYVDDFYFVISDKQYFLNNIIPEIRNRLNQLGAKLNEKKFYCQHYTKGCECLGVHIKFNRKYPNKRVIKRGIKRIKELNKCIRVSKIDKLLASVNSYLGICKNTNGYNQAKLLLSYLNPNWYKYVQFNSLRCILLALPEYNYRNRLLLKYNIYDKKRKNRDTKISK